MIVPTALRISAARALASAGTLAGDKRVFDSAILALDQLVGDTPQPFIVVSTEDEVIKPSGRDLNTGDREIDLVLETAMTQVTALPAKDDEDELIQVTVPNTDAGLELSLGVLNRQMMACLFGRGGGAWGDVFRLLTSGVKEVVSRRGVQSKDGVRFAARQTVLTLQAIAEPAFGQELDPQHPLTAFLGAALADEVTAPLAKVLKEAIEGVPQDWPAFYSAAGVLAGYTDAEAQAIGIYPLAPAEGEDDIEVLTEAVAMGEDGEEFVANAETIAEQLPEEPDV